MIEKMEKEEWKDIEGFEGDYQISNLGRVKSVKFGKEKILKPRVNANGYLCVGLRKCGNQKWFLVHRLVMQAFISNEDNLPQVNHKDEDKTNNCVCNLEWCDAKYNTNYGSRNERMSVTKTNGKSSNKVLMYDLNMNFISEFPSVCEVERVLGFAKPNISSVCRGKRKQAYGYIFRYA